ncbi:MAG TPA: class I SAM-dependent methyltransferase, partial [Acidobacteriota bacterium]|nr:class I SAM-dependent methyltransferase [Acidobacteriota bacterium]
MAKEDEIAYYDRLNEQGKRHAEGKPFTDADCGGLLIGLGQVMTLLPPAPASILDVGCGTGWTSEFLARAGFQVTGLDISPSMIETSRRLRTLPGLEFVAGDFECMTFETQFDAVLFFGSLHHSEDPEAALASSRNALKEGGLIVLMEPGEGHEEAESSQSCAQEFGLTERSLPP